MNESSIVLAAIQAVNVLMHCGKSLDLEGTGDTAFPALIENEDGTFTLMNYSSDLAKRSKNWIRGQLGKTYIYKTVLKVDF